MGGTLRFRRRTRPAPGVSTLVVVTALTVVLSASVAGTARWHLVQTQARDGYRQEALADVALAQEYHFDRYQRYGTFDELVTSHLIAAVPRDPVTGSPYQLFRTAAGDEWCAWARLEANVDHYLTHSEHRATTVRRLPINLATCKN